MRFRSTHRELFDLVSDQLYKNGRCKPDTWITVTVESNGKHIPVCEAMQPSRGNIRIRKPIKLAGVNGYGEKTYYFEVFRFTRKLELVYEGIIEAERLKE